MYKLNKKLFHKIYKNYLEEKINKRSVHYLRNIISQFHIKRSIFVALRKFPMRDCTEKMQLHKSKRSKYIQSGA